MLLLWAGLLVNCLMYMKAVEYPPYDMALAPVEILLALSLVLLVKGNPHMSDKLILYKLIGFVFFFFMAMCIGTYGRPPYWIKQKHAWESNLANMLFVLPIFVVFVLPLTLALGFYIVRNSRGSARKKGSASEWDAQPEEGPA